MRTGTLRTIDAITDIIGEERMLEALKTGLEAGKRQEWSEGEVIKFCEAQVKLQKGMKALLYEE